MLFSNNIYNKKMTFLKISDRLVQTDNKKLRTYEVAPQAADLKNAQSTGLQRQFACGVFSLIGQNQLDLWPNPEIFDPLDFSGFKIPRFLSPIFLNLGFLGISRDFSEFLGISQDFLGFLRISRDLPGLEYPVDISIPDSRKIQAKVIIEKSHGGRFLWNRN